MQTNAPLRRTDDGNVAVATLAPASAPVTRLDNRPLALRVPSGRLTQGAPAPRPLLGALAAPRDSCCGRVVHSSFAFAVSRRRHWEWRSTSISHSATYGLSNTYIYVHGAGLQHVPDRVLPRWALGISRQIPVLILRGKASAGNDRAQRSELNAARTSVEKSSGSSQAAKWPPLSTSLK
jgi:hypothetical protein